MEIKWSFIISENNNYIRNLINDLHFEDLIFYEDGDEESDLTYYFSSIHLNHLENPDVIYNHAHQLYALLNGIDLIIQEEKSNHQIITLDRMIDVQNRHVVFYKKTQNPNIFDIDFSINITTEPKSKNYIINLFEILKKDEFILNLLFIISDGMSFQTLYQAFDEIRTFLKTKNDSLTNLGFSKAQINDFTHTANNFKSLGKKARHGSTGQLAPQTPMQIEDAQTLISNIIREVLKKHYELDLPLKKTFNINPNDLFN